MKKASPKAGRQILVQRRLGVNSVLPDPRQDQIEAQSRITGVLPCCCGLAVPVCPCCWGAGVGVPPCWAGFGFDILTAPVMSRHSAVAVLYIPDSAIQRPKQGTNAVHLQRLPKCGKTDSAGKSHLSVRLADQIAQKNGAACLTGWHILLCHSGSWTALCASALNEGDQGLAGSGDFMP